MQKYSLFGYVNLSRSLGYLFGTYLMILWRWFSGFSYLEMLLRSSFGSQRKQSFFSQTKTIAMADQNQTVSTANTQLSKGGIEE